MIEAIDINPKYKSKIIYGMAYGRCVGDYNDYSNTIFDIKLNGVHNFQLNRLTQLVTKKDINYYELTNIQVFDSQNKNDSIEYDTLFAEIARDAVSSGQISTSSIQRNYEIGFNRASRIMIQLERAGIVGRQDGAKPRHIYIQDMQELETLLQKLGIY